MQVFQYDGTEVEQEKITQEQLAKGLFLIQVANITEGNFLFFDDRQLIYQKTPIEEQIDAIKVENNLLKKQNEALQNQLESTASAVDFILMNFAPPETGGNNRMNETYIEKLLRLIGAGLITVDDIKDPVYKTEVQARLATPA